MSRGFQLDGYSSHREVQNKEAGKDPASFSLNEMDKPEYQTSRQGAAGVEPDILNGRTSSGEDLNGLIQKSAEPADHWR